MKLWLVQYRATLSRGTERTQKEFLKNVKYMVFILDGNSETGCTQGAIPII